MADRLTTFKLSKTSQPEKRRVAAKSDRCARKAAHITLRGHAKEPAD